MIWVLEETQEDGVYQLGFFGRNRRARGGHAGDGLGMWTALVGTLDQFEELGRALLGDVASLRAAAEQRDEAAAG